MPPGSPPTMVVVKKDDFFGDIQEKVGLINDFSDLPESSATRDEDLDAIVFSNGKRRKWLKDWSVVKEFDAEEKFIDWTKNFMKGYVRGTTARLRDRRCTYYRCQFNKRVGYRPCSCEVRVEFRTDTNHIKVEKCGEFPFSDHIHEVEASSSDLKSETPCGSQNGVTASGRPRFKPEIKSMMNLGIQMMLKPIDIAKIIEDAGYNSPNVQQISTYKKRNKRKISKEYDPIIDANYLLNLAKQNDTV